MRIRLGDFDRHRMKFNFSSSTSATLVQCVAIHDRKRFNATAWIKKNHSLTTQFHLAQYGVLALLPHPACFGDDYGDSVLLSGDFEQLQAKIATWQFVLLLTLAAYSPAHQCMLRTFLLLSIFILAVALSFNALALSFNQVLPHFQRNFANNATKQTMTASRISRQAVKRSRWQRA